MNKTLQGLLLVLLIFMVAPLRAATLTVVYPKMKAPRDEPYNQIIAGIKQEFKGKVTLVEVAKKMDKKAQAALAAQTEKQKPDMVIALGSRGRKIARLFKSKTPWVTGASSIKANANSGIVPIADPNVMFTNLKTLAPNVKRLFVVYSKKNDWLIELAKEAAGKHDMTIFTYPVQNRADAMVQYNQLINTALGKDDAIWLPLDKKSADSQYVLPLLLEAAWERRFVVYSSSPGYVSRGALFSLIPDNQATGAELVKMVGSMYNKSTVPGVQTTAVVKLAVNLRTASHLGLEYTTKQKGQFHLTFPTN